MFLFKHKQTLAALMEPGEVEVDRKEEPCCSLRSESLVHWDMTCADMTNVCNWLLVARAFH